MAIKTNPVTVSVYTDPPTITAHIVVLSGNNVQTYDSEALEYEPDRALVPLVLMPYVNLSYPGEPVSTDAEITAVEWYEGVPKGSSNRITDGNGYEICDGTEDGLPNGALKVTKNTPTESPVDLYATAYFTNKQTGSAMTITRRITMYSVVFKGHDYNLKLTDQPSKLVVDPLKETPGTDGAWLHTATMQLYDGNDAVADANAAYWWEILDNGKWRAVTDDDIDLFLDCKDASGNFKKSLTLDARMVDKASFRCKAGYYEGIRPSAPSDSSVVAEFSVAVQLPETIDVRIRQCKGGKMGLALDTQVGYECTLYDNRGDLPAEKYEFFDIGWVAKSEAPGSREISVGEGSTVSFVPSQKGLQPGYGFNTWVAVRLYQKHAFVTDGDAYVTDAAGNLLIDKVFA